MSTVVEQNQNSLAFSKLALLGSCAVLTLALDLWSKSWAWEHLREPRHTVKVIDQVFYLSFSFNTGSAFGFLQGSPYARPLFIAMTLFMLIYMAYLAYKLSSKHIVGLIAIGLIVGGALGNLHDRFVRQLMQGDELAYGVVDFIKVYYWKGKPWPTFNIADVGLTVGAILLIIFFIRHGEPQRASKQQVINSS